MRRLLAMAACALGIVGSAAAVTPVAEWTDFHNLTSGDYTWVKNSSCTVNPDGSLTIGSSGGLTMAISSGTIYTNNSLTIVAEVSGLAKGSDKRSVFDISCTDNRVGLTMFTDGICYQTWNLNNGYNNTGTVGSDKHTIAMTYVYNAGTTTYIDGDKKCEASSLKSSGSKVNGLGIGCYNGTSNVATGMRITKLTLYDAKIILDDIGAPVQHWYKYDGNMTSYGQTALNVYGANSNYVGGPQYKAYLINGTGAAPYGAGLTLGTGNWAVGCRARGASNESASQKRIFWSLGTNSGTYFGLAMTDDTHVEMFLKGSGALVTAEVPNATTQYHYYVIARDAENNTYSLYVDGVRKGSDSAAVELSANYQWGSVYGGAPSGYAFGIGISLDDWRVWQEKPSDAQLAKLAALYPVGDEIDIVPTHRYAYNGNFDSWGATALTISGENAASYVDSGHVKAYKTVNDSAHPYGSGFDYNTNVWTFVTHARSPDVAGRVMWTVGTKAGGVLGLAAAGDDKVKVVKTTGNVAATTLLTSDAISLFPSKYHLYVLTCEKSLLKLYVDGVLQTQTYTGTDAALPNGSWQLGGVNGGIGDTGLSRGDVCIDEWRYYKATAFTAEQVASLTTSFAPWCVSRVSVSFTPSAAADWTGKTIPTTSSVADVTATPVSFTGNADYLQELASGDATVALVTNTVDAASIFGLVAVDAGNGAGAIDRDVYLKVTSGNTHLISGGEDAGYNSSSKTIPTGNLLTQVGGDVKTDYIFGAGRGGGGGNVLAEVKGNVGVTIEGDAQVLGSAAAGWSSAHNARPKVSGNTSLLVKNVQTRPGDPVSGQYAVQNGWLVGGSIYESNTTSGGEITGDSSVTVDLPNDAGGTFAMGIVGGSFRQTSAENSAMAVNGNASVTIDAPAGVVFTGAIYAGGYGDATVAGNATLTLNGGTFSNATLTAGNADGAKSLLIGGATTFCLPGVSVSDFTKYAFSDDVALNLNVTSDASLSLPTGVGQVVKNGLGTLSIGAPSALEAYVAIYGGKIQLVLTDEQIAGGVAISCFKSAQSLELWRERILAVNGAGLPISGEVTLDDETVKFRPTVELYTRTIAAGGTVDWSDSGWTRDGETGQKYAPASGKSAVVTVTIQGEAVIDMQAAPESLATIRIEKGAGVESANASIRFAPATLPTDSKTNVHYTVFGGLVPTLGDGVAATFAPALDARRYAWAVDESAWTFFAAKRPEKGSINIRIGARGTTDDSGYIRDSLESVGANPLSGLLWYHAKTYTETTQKDPGYTDLGYVTDANGSGRQIRYALRGPNTYWSASTYQTGNAVLTRTYVDDGSTVATKTWTIANETNASDTATLPAAPNARGWQIHLDQLPYAAFDLYFITASDRSSDVLKETPIKLSADGGTTWVSFTAENGETKQGDSNWDGVGWESGTLVEGKNYLRMRVSASIMGVDKIESLEITHGARDVSNNIRSGLAAIQLVELDNDGVFTLTGPGGWTKDAIWSSGGVTGKTWVNDATNSYATIKASETIDSVTVDGDVAAKQVTLTGSTDFTLWGTNTIASDVNVSQYNGSLWLYAPISGMLTFGTSSEALAKIVFNVDDGERAAYQYEFSGKPSLLTKTGAGTLVYNFSPTYLMTISEGAVCLTNAVPTAKMTINEGASLQFDVTDGMSVSCAAAFAGKGKIVKTGCGKLTITSSSSSFDGPIDICEGTIAMKSTSALGKGGVATVFDGATLDYSGCYPALTNPIVISGNGVDGMGAIVNTGSAMGNNSALKVTLAADATIGGKARLMYGSASSINLQGHTLTFSGTSASSFVVPLSGTTITGGGGKVVIGVCKFTNSGASTLKDADLEILAQGTLDLSSGTSIACRDFASSGTISGSTAMLIVNGTFDASHAVSLARLQLNSGATLYGTGLKVTSALTLGANLDVRVDGEDGTNLKIATVPANTVVKDTTVTFNGKSGYVLFLRNNTDLCVTTEGALTADVTLDDPLPGVNFESLTVGGSVKFDTHTVGAQAGVTNVCIVLTDGEGTVVTQRFEYAGGGDGTFSYEIKNLDAGELYVASVFLEIVGDTVHASSESIDAVTARSLDWIDEDADTFAGTRASTGIWSGTKDLTSVSGDLINFSGLDWTASVVFNPTNAALSARSSMVKDIHFFAKFQYPGFYSDETAPEIPSDQVAGVCLYADDNDEDDPYRFAVLANGAWKIVAAGVYPGTVDADTEYEIFIRLDSVAEQIVYSVVHPETGKTIHLATCVLPKNSDDLCLDFAGSGAIEKVTGNCHDANLMQVGNEEFLDVDAARVVAGTTQDIVPLWWSRYVVSDAAGTMRIRDAASYLDVVFAKWYRYSTVIDDDLSVYRYVASNNWIEYSDKTGVEERGDEWLVTNECGLAWIAETATNAWFSGTIALGADLDLSSKNWTPIASFTGVFDGKGHAIKGLNNTNIIDDVLLGESGHYFGGPTNAWGHSAYGLFATTTNATLRNVSFEDVAISNQASAVAALVGLHEDGALDVRNVTVRSGCVLGEGGSVAGVVGKAENFVRLYAVSNENEATVCANAPVYGDPRWASGILTIGGDAVGSLVVTGNVNRGEIGNTIFNNANGGNVAQILAGTEWDTTFDDVIATNNVGEGKVDVVWVDHDGYTFELPICNLAAAVMRILSDETSEGCYRRFVESNDPSSVPVDPVYRTARMSAGTFANGADNIAGWWIDTITAIGDGGTVTINGSDNTLDFWETVVIDRNVTIDLNMNCVYALYDCDAFAVAEGKKLTLKNGVVYYSHDYKPTSGSVELVDVKTAEIPGTTFYDRTVPVSDLDVNSGYVTIVIPYTSKNFYYVVDSTPTLAEDWTQRTYAEGTGQELSIQVPAEDASGFYRVRITEVNPAD